MKGTAFESDRNEAMKLLQDLVKIKDSLYRFASVNNEARNPFNQQLIVLQMILDASAVI